MTMTSGEPLVIEARGLVKSFGAIRAVDGLDLSVPRGGMFALLEPNGAGKSNIGKVIDRSFLRRMPRIPLPGNSGKYAISRSHDGSTGCC